MKGEGKMTKDQLPRAKDKGQTTKVKLPTPKSQYPIPNNQPPTTSNQQPVKKLFDSVSTHRTGGILPQVEGRGFADFTNLDIISLQTSLMF
jgi:hypothetical protein